MENIRKNYAHINNAIKKNLELKNVDISKVIEKYAEGIAEDNIRILYKLTQDELSYILSKYVTPKIIERRTKNRNVLNVKGCNYMGFSKKQQKEDDKEVLSIEEALALFEER